MASSPVRIELIDGTDLVAGGALPDADDMSPGNWREKGGKKERENEIRAGRG